MNQIFFITRSPFDPAEFLYLVLDGPYIKRNINVMVVKGWHNKNKYSKHRFVRAAVLVLKLKLLMLDLVT